MQLEDWLDDLCVRFIVNLPQEELDSVERICFQVEEAQWFYEDFIRPLDVSLPHLSLQQFSLKIFQHCPLFSQWSAQHYQTAFAEFMAYKQRVPVRGAIMLNDDMDEVVLVKGWKKSANWSFPRGKINKDEDDLDCAVREVYEETGLDLRAAGLVPERHQVKSIEMTMREQHMMLFVFRGIPKHTHFEARTRKEISKIEWYRLEDLPTFKKKGKQEAHDPNMPNANKFYMVAPFLSHLKKWINAQRKLDQQKHGRNSSNLAAPPLVFEESEVEVLPEFSRQPHVQAQPASDLPEVTAAPTDHTAQLRAMFDIPPTAAQVQTQAQPAHMAQVDTVKSNALLSLLKGPSVAEMRASPQTPRTPGRVHSSQSAALQGQGQAPVAFQSELPTSPQPHTQPMASLQPGMQPPLSASFPFQLPSHGGPAAAQAAPMQPMQLRGEPDYIHNSNPVSLAPPASALPQLTSHAKSLLDAFKSVSPPPSAAIPASSSVIQPPRSNQSLLDILKSPSTAVASEPGPAVSPTEPAAVSTGTTIRRPTGAHQNSLLQLFGQGNSAPKTPALPVELAAAPAEHQKVEDESKDSLLALLRKEAPRKPGSKPSQSTFKEGETSAVMNGPLDQPNFEAVSRKQKVDTNGMRRSPLTTHRKLYDPNEPPPVRILARPQTPRGGKSPQPQKAKVVSSSPRKAPKSSKKDKEGEREQAKPTFQPQILRRPQNGEQGSPAAPLAVESTVMSRGGSGESTAAVDRRPSHPDAQKQSLLSLFGGSMPPPPAKTSQQSSRVVSPLSTSHILSPKEEVPISALEPISTRSRVGSLASVGSGPVSASRPPVEKRTTGAENKAFLLSYLTKMTSPEA